MSKISATVTAPENRQAPPAPVLRDALELVVSAVVPRTKTIVLVHLRAAGQQDLPGFVPGSNLAVECRLGVQAGRPLHRDSYLSDEERAEAASIVCCVSRSIDPDMELELLPSR